MCVCVYVYVIIIALERVSLLKYLTLPMAFVSSFNNNYSWERPQGINCMLLISLKPFMMSMFIGMFNNLCFLRTFHLRIPVCFININSLSTATRKRYMCICGLSMPQMIKWSTLCHKEWTRQLWKSFFDCIIYFKHTYKTIKLRKGLLESVT